MIFPKIALRNHTCFSGGLYPPEAMIRSAIEAGAQAIGISYLAPASFSFSQKTQAEDPAAFRREIAELSEKYSEKLRVLTVEERDFFADPVFPACDIRMGFVHTLVADDGAVCRLDTSAGQILSDAKIYFGGDLYKLAQRYFETLALLVKKTRCDLIVDFDFLQTFNSENRLFDPDSPKYRSAVLDAMEALVREDVAFEIRLRESGKGALSFSPAPDVVRWLADHGARFFLSSNAKRKEDLFAGFSECAMYARSCGVGGFSYPLDGKWSTISIGRES